MSVHVVIEVTGPETERAEIVGAVEHAVDGLWEDLYLPDTDSFRAEMVIVWRDAEAP